MALTLASAWFRESLDGETIDAVSAALQQLSADLTRQLEQLAGKRGGNRSVDDHEKLFRCAVLACVDFLVEAGNARPAARAAVASRVRQFARPDPNADDPRWPSQKHVETTIERWEIDWFQHRPADGLLKAKDVRAGVAEAIRERVGSSETPNNAVDTVLATVASMTGRGRRTIGKSD